MNKAAKKRLVIVSLIIVIVAVVLFCVLGSGGTATSLSVAQAASGDYQGKKVQVAGAVVQDSYTSEGSSAVFSIADDDTAATLRVTYSGAMPATFGNGVTAICTGVIDGDGLTCTSLVTKCPSKYESAEGSVTVATLLDNADAYKGAEVKLAGYVTAGTIAGIDAAVRFTVNSQGSSLDVAFDGALPEGMEDGSAVVVTGALSQDATVFEADEVALDAAVQTQG